MDKQLLRQQLRQKRRALDTARHQQLSTQIADNLTKTSYFQQSHSIACYLAQDGEVDTQYIIRIIWQQKKLCFLPVIDPHLKTLRFALYTENCSIRNNQYGIPEPIDTIIIPAEELDLMVAPLVGFDSDNHRLGMGGGFYDRTLAGCKHKKPVFVGLAFSFQHIEILPHEPHDAILEFIITE